MSTSPTIELDSRAETEKRLEAQRDALHPDKIKPKLAAVPFIPEDAPQDLKAEITAEVQEAQKNAIIRSAPQESEEDQVDPTVRVPLVEEYGLCLPNQEKFEAALKALQARQARFVTEYLIDLNGPAAAKRAGYLHKNPKDAAKRLLQNERVQNAIWAGILMRRAAADVEIDRVVHELAQIAFSDPKALLEWDEKTGVHVKPSCDTTWAERACIKEITEKGKRKDGTYKITITFFDKLEAIDRLTRLLGFDDEKDRKGTMDGFQFVQFVRGNIENQEPITPLPGAPKPPLEDTGGHN